MTQVYEHLQTLYGKRTQNLIFLVIFCDYFFNGCMKSVHTGVILNEPTLFFSFFLMVFSQRCHAKNYVRFPKEPFSLNILTLYGMQYVLNMKYFLWHEIASIMQIKKDFWKKKDFGGGGYHNGKW